MGLKMRDYSKYTFRFALAVVAVLLVVTLAPPFSLFGISFRRTNILSDLIFFDDKAPEKAGELTASDLDFLDDAAALGNLEMPQDTGGGGHEGVNEGYPMEQRGVTGLAEGEGEAGTGRQIATAGGGSAFEDYTPAGSFTVADFVNTLENHSSRRTVRMAFFGDSFIEGDIITCDIREQLQEAYGGSGVGFVPIGTPLAISRPSVKHAFGGWKNYNLIYKKNVPSPWRDMFTVSGAVSVPETGAAWAEYRGTGFRKKLGSWSRARFLFVDKGGANIEVAVNDSITRRFDPAPSGELQQIALTGGGMKSLRVSVNSPNSGFVGYGVVLEGSHGVAVDNFAIRSNSGIAMFGTGRAANEQLGRMLGYDLIVLQWGLNAMESGATDFKSYGTQLRRVINYLKGCFPRSAIVVMSVGDRTGHYAVGAMIAEQRAAARACGVAFWDTRAAMGGDGSMASFVERGWAAKDYTHLSYSGGRYIATKFVESLMALRGEGAARGAMSHGVAEPHSEVLDMSKATNPPMHTDSVPRPVVRDTVRVTETPAKQVADTVKVVEQQRTVDKLEAAVDSTLILESRE